MRTSNMFVIFSLGIFVFICQSDAKGIKVGGIKVPKPPVRIPKPPVPVVIVPAVVPIGIHPDQGWYNHRNSRLQCYSCEGSNTDLCAINPAANAKKITCPEREYCSIIRNEIPVGSFPNGTSDSPQTSNNSRIDIEINKSEGLNSTTLATDVAADFNDNSTLTLDFKENSYTVADNSTSLSRTTRATTRTVIRRGCKSADILEGTLLSPSKTDSNDTNTGKVYVQLCSTDLCNSGDGRLRCYQCKGTGIKHSCMVKPTDVAEVAICKPQESCYVERKTIMKSANSSDASVVLVSRGCAASSSSDDQNKISRTNGTLRMSCRLNDLCNAFDANKLIRSNSATKHSASLLVLFSIVLFTQM